MEVFKNDETGYCAWHDTHPDAYVFNRFGGTNPAFNVLHRSKCSFLWREMDEGSRTVVEKWCSISQTEIEDQAASLLGPGMWKSCGVCFSGPLFDDSRECIAAIPEKSDAISDNQIWIEGEPAVWLGSGEKQWKNHVCSVLRDTVPDELPQWFNIEFRLPEKKLHSKDIDNLLTPLLESARDAGWIERGFSRLGSVTSRKVGVEEPYKAGALVKWYSSPPSLDDLRAGILVEAQLPTLDANSVKWAVYEKSFEIFQRQPALRFPPISPMSLDIRITIDNEQRRKSIQAMMKPCIDGLEPILGHPDNLLPLSREEMTRRLAPQDEMVMQLAFHVRGGNTNKVSIIVAPEG